MASNICRDSVIRDLPVRFWFSIYIAVSVFLAFALPLVILKHAFITHYDTHFLYGGIGDSELRDRLLYLPFYFLAPIAVLCANWRVPVHQMPPPSNALLLFPVIGLAHLSLFANSTNLRILFWCLAAASIVTAMRWRCAQNEPTVVASPIVAWRLSWLDAAAIAAICILLLPASTERLAAHIGVGGGNLSYFIGPALYSYGVDLTPGLSFYSNYGIGLGPIFSHLIGAGWKAAAINSAELTVLVTVLFYCSEYLLLQFMTGSRLLAFGVPLFTALLSFASYVPFNLPSSYPSRYPFLLPFVLAFGWYCGREFRLAPVVVMSIFAGLSLFWQTEVGIYLILAGCAGMFFARGNRPLELPWIAIFVIGSLAVFFASAGLIIGPSALSVPFIKGVAQPITTFAGGWDGLPVKWGTLWSLFYNIPLQAIAASTIGGFWFLMWSRHDTLTVRERQIGGVLAMLSLVGLEMLAKWINRSLDAVWHDNAVLLIMVACWWGHFLWTASGARRSLMLAGRSARFAVAVTPFLAATAVLLTVDDVSNPNPYGLRSFVAYPSLAKALVAPSRLYEPLFDHDGTSFGWDWSNLLTEISSDDIALIQRYTKPHERALVISIVDWAYLAQAQRAPKAFFVPFFWTFDAEFVDRSFKDADTIFVDTRISLDTGNPSPLDRLVFDYIDKEYIAENSSTTLRLYRSRKSMERLPEIERPRAANHP